MTWRLIAALTGIWTVLSVICFAALGATGWVIRRLRDWRTRRMYRILITTFEPGEIDDMIADAWERDADRHRQILDAIARADETVH